MTNPDQVSARTPLLTGQRMVFASEFQQGGTGQGLAHGFRQLGWAVHEIDHRGFIPRATGTLARALSKPLQVPFKRAYNHAIVDAARMIQPQVFITIKGSDINVATLRMLRAGAVKTVLFYPDRDFDHRNLDRDTFPLYDHFVTTKSYHVDYLRRMLGESKVAFLHHGYSDLVHRPACNKIEPTADVLYLGNYSSEKADWLSRLIAEIPDAGVRVLGFGWNRARQANLKSALEGHGLTGDCYARAIQLARINIALHSDRKEPEGWQDLVSTRTFEIPACKGFMLHIDNPEVRSIFEPGREIGVFASVEELASQIRYYLQHPEERAEMIERAYARCVPAYGYSARAAEIARLFVPVQSR